MHALRRMRGPWWMRAVFKLRLTHVIRLFRRDTHLAPPGERASDDDGLRMLVLARAAKRCGFELRKMRRRTSVLIQDLAFNSILVAANHALEDLAAIAGQTLNDELAARFAAAAQALDTLWDEDRAQYFSRDARRARLVHLPTVSTFLPLLTSTVPADRQTRLRAWLDSGSGFWPAFPVPSVPTDAADFDDDRYWMGPTWVNTNWLIVRGLRSSGAHELADDLRERTLRLVEQRGFSEYFSAITGEGFGADDFSWTAALTLDLIADESTRRAELAND